MAGYPCLDTLSLTAKAKRLAALKPACPVANWYGVWTAVSFSWRSLRERERERDEASPGFLGFDARLSVVCNFHLDKLHDRSRLLTIIAYVSTVMQAFYVVALKCNRSRLCQATLNHE
ncbi:hypothetical protein COU91_03120, partial [Candidatus Saccharibacteria bacterium CG10_big_fil_rev_8_21_14_0_10_47_8]